MLPPIRGSQAPARDQIRRRPASGGFTLPEAAPRAASAAGSVQGSFGMLGLQEGWSPAERDAAARRRGAAVLRELAGLQLALLDGGIDSARLSRLAMLAEGEAGADPALREITDAISLRARIELARRGG
ncbi:flagellar assembly protein FliX [Sediminicoccus sp. KRV36]|uniref:flagellar assembly protein FliX n=1 Tax=Sediminicoccus sp. KRV36 TaxID=3133721 RepID=UPI00200C2954|nr:flagellar assembly protein FliX [Sediminicoccus rosea]UPY35356.1 hypothetical protein LHU95_14100 [Sediminicoccus rosea]